MAESYAGSILSSLRGKRLEEIQTAKEQEAARLNIPGMIAGMLAGTIAKGGEKGFDITNILSPEAMFGGVSGGAQPRSTDEFRNALVGAVSGLGTAQAFQKTGRETAAETLKQGLDISKIKTDVAKEFDLVPAATEGAFDASKAFPGLFEAGTFLKRKPQPLGWPGLIGPNLFPGASGGSTMRAPDGSTELVPAANVEAAKAAGYTEVK